MNIIALIAGAITLVVVVLLWRFVRRPLVTALVAFVGFWVVWTAASGWTWIFYVTLGVLVVLVIVGLFKPAATMLWFKWFAVACVTLVVIGALASSNIGAVRSEESAAETSPTASPTVTIDMAALAQCRVDALTAYMTEQGFTDGDYVVGEERIDTSLSEFSRQGSLGFRQGDALPETREQLAELFASTDENVNLAIDAQVRKFPDIERETLLNVNNWEIVQTTVTSVVQGNSGLSGNVQVSVGDTTSEAGDAAWVFIDTTSCEVARSYITATGEELPADTDKPDLPVAALRPGCINPTDGFKPVPPPTPPTPTPGPPTPPTPTPGKNPGLDPENQGNNKPGGDGLAPAVTEPTSPPAAGEPEPTYTPPPAVQTPAPKVTPTPKVTSEPVPTVVPSEQPVNNGEVVSPGDGDACTTEAKEFGLCS